MPHRAVSQPPAESQAPKGACSRTISGQAGSTRTPCPLFQLPEAGPQGPVCRLRPPVARSPSGRVFTPPPPQGPAVASGRGQRGRFLFRFQGAYVKGAAIDSPCADGYTHERPPRYRDSDVGAAGLAPAAACGRRPCGFTRLLQSTSSHARCALGPFQPTAARCSRRHSS